MSNNINIRHRIHPGNISFKNSIRHRIHPGNISFKNSSKLTSLDFISLVNYCEKKGVNQKSIIYDNRSICNFYTVPMKLNGVMISQIVCVCVCVRMYVTNCHQSLYTVPTDSMVLCDEAFCMFVYMYILYDHHEMSPGTNGKKHQFWHEYVCRKSKFVRQFSSKLSTPLTSFSQSKIRIEYIEKFMCEYLTSL